jgi:hypothetical protein
MPEEALPGAEPTSYRRRAFQPLGQFAGHDLTFSYRRSPDGPWELLDRDDLVGIVDRSSGSVRGNAGRWIVQVRRRVLGWRLSFEPFSRRQPSALYTPRSVRPGGTLALSDGTTYRFRLQRPFSQAWTLWDVETGDELARLGPERPIYVPGEWIVGLGAGVSDEPAATLAVLAGCFALLVDQAQRTLSTG